MDIHINTIYLIDAKDLGSKQCRCEIEMMGKLPDESAIREKERSVTWGGNHGTGARVWVAKHFKEPAALEAIENKALKFI